MSESDDTNILLVLGLIAVPVVVIVAVVLLVVGGTVGSLLALPAATPVVEATSTAPTTAERAPTVADDSAESPPPGTLNRLVIVDGGGRLITSAPDGSAQRILSRDGTIYQFPAWAPDGSALAVIGLSRQGAGVYVAQDCRPGERCSAESDPSASPLIPVYEAENNAPIYLYWSPDNRFVSFIANSTRGGLALHLGRPDGSGAEVIATGQPFYWAWADSAEEILIHTGGVGAEGRLTFIDLTGAERGGQLAIPGYFQAPDISATGDYVAYARESATGARQIIIKGRADAAEQSTLHAGNTAIGWNPARDELAYISSAHRGGTFGPLQIIDAATGARTLISDKLVVAFFWSPDGNRLAYLTPNFPDLLPEVADRTRRARLGDAPQPVQDDSVLLDLWIVDFTRDETRLIATFEPNSLFTGQFLPFFDQYARSHRLWSPDSREIVLPVVEDGRSLLYRFSVDGPRQLVREGVIAFWSRQ